MTRGLVPSYLLGMCGVACAFALAGCQEPPSREADSGRAGSVVRTERVVSVPIGPGRQPIVSVAGLGRLTARCSCGQTVGVVYRNTTEISQSAAAVAWVTASATRLGPAVCFLSARGVR
jgi:hypothetical protein